MKGDHYIWRDAVDQYQFWIGVEGGNGKISGWAPIFEDGLFDMFGPDFAGKAKDLKPSTPTRLKLRVSIAE